LLSKRLFAIEPRFCFAGDAESEKLGLGHLLLDEMEVIGPVVLLRYQRFLLWDTVLIAVGPMRREGRVEFLDALKIGHGKAHQNVALLLDELRARGVGPAPSGSISSSTATIGPVFVVLGEVAELMSEVDGVNPASARAFS
jgi:hypothetical protein